MLVVIKRERNQVKKRKGQQLDQKQYLLLVFSNFLPICGGNKSTERKEEYKATPTGK